MEKQHFSGIGGQAVMEGIMMRSRTDYAVAVRKADGTVSVKKEHSETFLMKHPKWNIPFIRGVISFVSSLVVGMKTLMWSAEEAAEDQVEPDGRKTEKAGTETNETGNTETENAVSLEKEDGKTKEAGSGKIEDGKTKETVFSTAEMVFTLLLAFALAIGIFSFLPLFLAKLLEKVIESPVLLALFEGLIRLAIFILYIFLISKMKDINRTFMYHGAEHKCINCVEHGLPLTVENVMKSSKEHRRCGTSFLIIVMLISVVLFIFIRPENFLLKFLTRILFIPVIAGISFEILQFTGKHDNKFTYLISRPGMWMQAMTTKEPTSDMVETAITATEAVFDWKTFLTENFNMQFPEEAENPENV